MFLVLGTSGMGGAEESKDLSQMELRREVTVALETGVVGAEVN